MTREKKDPFFGIFIWVYSFVFVSVALFIAFWLAPPLVVVRGPSFWEIAEMEIRSVDWSPLDPNAHQEGGLREYAMRDTEQEGGLRVFDDAPGIIVKPRSNNTY